MLPSIILAIIAEALVTAIIEFQIALSKMEKLAFLMILRAILSLGLAVGFSRLIEATPQVILFGHATGCLIAFFIGLIISKFGLPRYTNFKQEVKIMFDFGSPLSISVVFRILIQSMDRFVINVFLGEEAVGIYTIAFDFARRILGVAFLVVNLVLYPLMLRCVKSDDKNEMNKLILLNWIGLCAIGFSGVSGLFAVAPNALETMFGVVYVQDGAILIMGIASLCMFLESIKSLHFDLAFMLTEHTVLQIPINGACFIINLILLFVLVPKFGIIGAASAALITFICLLFGSWLIGRRFMRIPIEHVDTAKLLIVSLLMGTCVFFVPITIGALGLLIQVISGVAIFIIGVLLLNIRDCRQYIYDRMR